MPRECEPRHHQWWMSIGWRRMRNDGAGKVQVTGCRYVIAGFVPEIWQAQQRRVNQHQDGKKQCEEEQVLRPAWSGSMLQTFSIRAGNPHQCTGPPGCRGSS